jgi:hypothetical protein
MFRSIFSIVHDVVIYPIKRRGLTFSTSSPTGTAKNIRAARPDGRCHRRATGGLLPAPYEESWQPG